MFDEQNQNPVTPKNLPAEPLDMFATVEAGPRISAVAGVEKDGGEMKPGPTAAPDALSAGMLKKKDEVTVPPNQLQANKQISYKTSAPILGKILLFLFVVLLLGGLGYGGWWLFYKSKTSPAPQPAAPTVPTSQNQTPQNPPADTSANIPAQINNDQILFGQAIDSDKDGLDDVREKEIGTDSQNTDTDGDGLSDGDEVIIYKTDPLKADTDGDGLSDGDEVLIWKTNPLNPDTDGDSYPDGTEVKNGYSPLGPGKLFNLPASTTGGATSS